jgi:GTPase SAR1 family protein
VSSLHLSRFTQAKTAVLERLHQVVLLSDELERKDISELLLQTSKDLSNEKFHVVVLGEFSRGKSTFINALLWKRILPSSVKPTTAILNLLTYDQEQNYTLNFRDNTKKPESINEAKFLEITAPFEPQEGNRQEETQYEEALRRIQEIAYAEIGYPLDMLKEQVVIVDTPGTNDTDTAREEITYRFIPKSDAAIFVLSARMILSHSEMLFIKNRILEADIQKIFFVINFKDALQSATEQSKVVEFAYNELKKVIPEPRIYLVSSKQALLARRALRGEEVKGVPEPIELSGFPDLEMAIGSYLVEERGRHKLAKPIQRSVRLIDELIQQNIEFSRGTLHLPLEELNRKIEQIEPEFNRYKKSMEDILESLETKLSAYGQEMKTFARSQLEYIALQAVTFTQTYSGDLTKEAFLQSLEQVVAPLQTRLHQEVKEQQGRYIQVAFQDAYRRYLRQWGELQVSVQTIVVASSSLLELSSNKGEVASALDADPKGSEETAGIAFGLGAFGLLLAPITLIPLLAAGGMFLYSQFQNPRPKLLAKLRMQVEMRYNEQIPAMLQEFDRQWSENVHQQLNGFRTEMRRKYDTLEQQLLSLRDIKREEREKTEDRKNFLDLAHAKALKLREELQATLALIK